MNRELQKELMRQNPIKPLAAVDRCTLIAEQVRTITSHWRDTKGGAPRAEVDRRIENLCYAMDTVSNMLEHMAKSHGNAAVAEMILAKIENELNL